MMLCLINYLQSLIPYVVGNIRQYEVKYSYRQGLVGYLWGTCRVVVKSLVILPYLFLRPDRAFGCFDDGIRITLTGKEVLDNYIRLIPFKCAAGEKSHNILNVVVGCDGFVLFHISNLYWLNTISLYANRVPELTPSAPFCGKLWA